MIGIGYLCFMFVDLGGWFAIADVWGWLLVLLVVFFILCCLWRFDVVACGVFIAVDWFVGGGFSMVLWLLGVCGLLCT